MEIVNQDQDRSQKPLHKTKSHHDATRHLENTAPRFIATDTVRFDQPERVVPSGERVPIVVLHPNGILRLGIHHAWSTSEFIRVSAVAANWRQLLLNSNIASTRVGIFGLASPDPQDGSTQPEIEAQLSELASIIGDNPQIRWIVLANSLPSGYRQAIADAGASGLVVGEFTAERLESVVMWVDMGRCIGLDEPTISPSSSLPSTPNPEAVSQLDTLLHPNQRPAVESLSPTIGVPRHFDSRASANLKELSEREKQVLDGLVEGKTNQQIADGLFLSVKTVETYRSRVKQKLGVTDRASMVAILNSHRNDS